MNAVQRKVFVELIDKYLDGKATADEINLLESYYQLFDAAPAALGAIDQKEQELIGLALQKQIKNRIGIPVVPLYRTWPRIAIAVAAAIALIFGGAYFFNATQKNSMNFAQNDIAPGRNGATLTISNGQMITLDDAKKGVVIGEELKYSDGTPLSLHAGEGQNSAKGMLTASTAKGQTYEFTLPDGTTVWLNAESKIVFSSKFTGNERRILLSGEAYFAVKHNEKQPFRIESRGQVVEDIGTEFNIQAYEDDPQIKTTLVEGSASVVSVQHPKNSVVLSPNQQAILNSGKIKVQTADTEQETAWKQGVFMFRSERIGDLMKRVERWYNVNIVYEDISLAEMKFSGAISRYENISKLLDILQTTGQIHFQITDKQITVTK